MAPINEHPAVPERTLTELEGDTEDIQTDIDTGNEVVKEPCKHVAGIMYTTLILLNKIYCNLHVILINI